MPSTTNPLDKQIAGEHYKRFKIQPIEFFHANHIEGPEAIAIRYILRFRDKNGKEDLLKAIHTIQMLIALEYPDHD
jgi:hypothetical protein